MSIREMYEKQQDGRPLFGEGKNYRSSIHQALQMRSPIITEIFPTPKDRAARAKELAALRRSVGAAAEEDSSGAGVTHGADELGWAAEEPPNARRAASRLYGSALGGRGIWRLVNEARELYRGSWAIVAYQSGFGLLVSLSSCGG